MLTNERKPIMNKITAKKPPAYPENAITDTICLVCGEQIGKYGYIYRGKTVCKECVDYIRMQI